MQSFTVRFHVDAPPRKVWRVLHPPVPPNAQRPRVLEWPTGRMEILNEGDEAGEGLVRTCLLWSRAEGYHELEEQPDGTTVLTFHETYHAFNPLLRLLLERPVHAKISRDNIETYEHALGYVGSVKRLT